MFIYVGDLTPVFEAVRFEFVAVKSPRAWIHREHEGAIEGVFLYLTPR